MGKSKKVAKKAKAPKRAEAKPVRVPKSAQADGSNLDALRAPVVEAKSALDALEGELTALTEKAEARIGEARRAYLEVLGPFRAACKRAGQACEFEGGRGSAVSERVRFNVERTERGVKVSVEGKPASEELIPLATLKQSIGREAYRYCDTHVGKREDVGNKGGSLSNRLRAVLAGRREGGKA